MRNLGLALATLLSIVSLSSGALTASTEADAPSLDAAPMQNTCGDGQCQPPDDCHSCPQDCGSCCGDGRCAPPEDCRSCDRDCGRC